MAMILFCSVLLTAGEAKWLTSLDDAKKAAAAAKKMILVDFTGSDWCGWCIRLDKEVFSTPEFAKYAEENLILVKIDFPRKSKLPIQGKINKELANKYNIEGFPTIVIVDPTGKEVARTGYQEGGGAAYVALLKDLLKNAGK